MGFMTGVITGVAMSAGAAAWYLSRSGSRVRDQYRVEHRLAELGDLMERRTREMQSSMHAQVTEMRSKPGTKDDLLDAASAAAAEAEAASAAGAGSTPPKPKRTPKPTGA